GQRGDKELREIPIPSEKAGKWRVEEEFVGAIRGQEPLRLTTFADGVKYMEFTEAVHRSATSGQVVSLPLANVRR
ncbi:MAG: Gfo/Idh/MocA family protein, partial [Candidatus Entotheonellia bacterium]